MKALYFVSFAIFIFSLCLTSHVAKASVAEKYVGLCRLFADNTKVAVPDACGEYIECHTPTNYTIHICDPDMAFDVKSQKCVALKSSTNTQCKNACEGKNDIFVADRTNCHGYFYCLSGQPMWGSCPDGMHFDESIPMCVYKRDSKCTHVPNICELVPDKTQYRDENDCSNYFLCSKNAPTAKSCKNQFFNVQIQDCVNKADMVCTAHPHKADMCVKNKKPYVGYVPDQATCRGYFYCRNMGSVPDLEPIWGQCPEGKFFSEATQACVNPTDVKCEYNPCDGRGTMMVSSGNNNCHNYVLCENGAPVDERTCSWDYFFDEQYQACVPDIIYYESCDIKVK